MPSMSYCVFENTTIDLSQCVNMMSDAIENRRTLAEFLAGRSRYEAAAVTRLVSLAQDLLDCYEQLENQEETERSPEETEDELLVDEF